MARRKKLNEDQPQENIENTDDTFGLPEVEYEPLKREESLPEEQPSEDRVVHQETETHTYVEREETSQPEFSTPDYNDNNGDDGESSVWPKVLGIIAILLVTGGLIWYFGYYNPKKMEAKEKERQEQLAREEAQKREADRLAEEQRLAEQRRADSLANAQPKAGAIETLTSRTGRYYVVVASAIDGDLIMDYAKKLSPKGVSAKIIPPHGKIKFYRLAVAEGDTYGSTQSTADALKSEYSGGAWVIKY